MESGFGRKASVERWVLAVLRQRTAMIRSQKCELSEQIQNQLKQRVEAEAATCLLSLSLMDLSQQQEPLKQGWKPKVQQT